MRRRAPFGRVFGLGVLAALFVALPAAARSPRCPTASRFGSGDQVGNLNLVTPAKTLAAMRLVTTGKTYRLGIETNARTPAYPPRTFGITILQPGQSGGITLGPTRTTYNDDLIMGWVGIGTQIDGLGHLGIDHLYFNCHRAPEFVRPDGLRRLGIEHVPAVATRGVVLDMAGYLGADPLPEGTVFNRAEIEGALRRQGLATLEPGDVVLFHTGWLALIGTDDRRFGAGEPGLGREGARYLAERQVAMVGADTWGVEVVPAERGAGVFEVHQILLARNGIHLLENVFTAELVRDRAWEFLFTLGPPRITGAAQAIVNPVAIR